MLGFWAISGPSLADGGWFRVFTAVVHHADLAHLVQNALALLLLGGLLEQRVGAWFCAGALLIAAVVGAGFSSVFVVGASVGASGGIYGIVGVWLVLLGRAGRSGSDRSLLPTGFWLLVVCFFLADSLISALASSVPMGRASSIDWAAHLGGLLAGIAYGWIGRGHLRGRVRGEPAPTPRALRPLVLVLSGLFVVAFGVGRLRYGDGGPDTIEQLPDGPRKWMLVNNRTWRETTAQDPSRELLERWLPLMQRAVEQESQVLEYADTLASLYLELGRPWRAVEGELAVSWLRETDPFMAQYARFAWAAVRSGREPPPALNAPESVTAAGEVGRELRFELALREGQRPPDGLDLLCLRAGEPFGILRVQFGPTRGDGSFAVPRELLVSDADASAGDRGLELIPIAGLLRGARSAEGAAFSLRFWPRTREEFESRASFEE